MIKTTIVKMTPEEITTDGYLKIKESGEPMLFKFQQASDFRGKLKSVEWNVNDGVKHRIEPGSEDFKLFKQVGERPEIELSSSWLENLDIPKSVLSVLRIRMEFETFRQEPIWFAYLNVIITQGDMAADAEVPYRVPKDSVEVEPWEYGWEGE